ncbi:hypothetical protein [Helicobacter pylori]|uniref:hypothetical protein n=1 Tax=Helicobacter pylori TaxID=210 RepID=UPI001FD10573|nr:hypothetical protein [Helicobacter pylori]UOR81989.1 hypothetical protein MPF96_00370 [Helicobacter pylori]
MNTKGAVGDISNDERPNHASDTRTKERTLTPTHKTRLKPLTREPKKSVFKARVKEYLTPKTPTHN